MNINEAMEGLKKAASANSKQIVLNSLKEIFSFDCNKTLKKSIILISLILSIYSGIGDYTKIILGDYLDILMNINLIMFGLLFTGYSIFQALLSEKIIIILLNVKEKKTDPDEKSLLLRNNEYFINVMIVQFYCILLDVFIILIMKCINALNFNIFFASHRIIIDIIASFVIFAIISINLFSIVEVKSFIINIFRIFNLSAYFQVTEYLDKNSNTDSNSI